MNQFEPIWINLMVKTAVVAFPRLSVTTVVTGVYPRKKRIPEGGAVCTVYGVFAVLLKISHLTLTELPYILTLATPPGLTDLVINLRPLLYEYSIETSGKLPTPVPVGPGTPCAP